MLVLAPSKSDHQSVVGEPPRLMEDRFPVVEGLLVDDLGVWRAATLPRGRGMSRRNMIVIRLDLGSPGKPTI